MFREVCFPGSETLYADFSPLLAPREPERALTAEAVEVARAEFLLLLEEVDFGGDELIRSLEG